MKSSLSLEKLPEGDLECFNHCPVLPLEKGTYKLKKNARDTSQVSLGHPAGQTGVYRPVSQGFPVTSSKTDRKGHFSGKEKAHKHKQIFPVTARAGAPDRVGGGVSRPVARGQKFMCCVRNPRNINVFVRVPGREESGSRPGGSVTGVTEKLFMCQMFMCFFRPLTFAGDTRPSRGLSEILCGFFLCAFSCSLLFGGGPNTVSESTVSNTELSEFFGPHRVPGGKLSEFLRAYYLCAKANSPSLPQNSVRLSEFSSPKQYSRNSIPPVS